MASPGATGRSRARQPSGPVSLLTGVVVVVVGVLVAHSEGWATGAYWLIALAGSITATLAYAIPLIRGAAKLNSSSSQSAASLVRSDTMDPAVSHAVASKDLALGLAVQPAQTDDGGLTPQRVIVLTGHTTSGKTRIAESMHQDHPEWGWASCAAYVKAQARQRGLEVAGSVTDELGQQLVDELGGDGFLEQVIAKADLPQNPATLLIDDVYHAEVFDAIKTRWPHLQFISVDLPASMYQRLSASDSRPQINPLNEAFTALTAIHKPDLIVEAATDDREIRERTEELETALAA